MASLRTFSTGSIVALNKSIQSSSNRARVIDEKRSVPSNKESISIDACVDEERLLLARSHAVRRRRIDLALSEISCLFFLLNSFTKCETSRLSKSSPPKCVSPAVALTSKIPSSIVRSETSKVPPPRSKIKIFCSLDVILSKPYAIAAAVGSLIIRKTFNPAIEPASFVAVL